MKADSDLESDVTCESEPVEWLVNGGEMGKAVRAFDWSTTPLGGRKLWPQSLKFAANLCLNSRFPMFLWWGPELVNIYNDGYAPLLGHRHPLALGRPAQQTWSDLWPALAQQVEDVFQRGQASWNERVLLVTNRKGYEEEAYFTFSYSPAFDDKGKVLGLVCVVSEETSHVLTERRQAFQVELNDLLRDLNKPVEIISAAVEALGKHLKTNRVGYGQILPDNERIVLESSYTSGVRSIAGTFPLNSFGVDNIALQRQGVTVVNNDVTQNESNNPSTWAAIETRSFVSVPLIRDGRLAATLYVNQKEARVWRPEEVTLIEDVARRIWEALERSRAEEEERKSAERLMFALEAGGGVGTWDCDVPADRLYCNAPFARLFSVDPDRAAKGAPMSEFLPAIHPDDRDAVEDKIRNALDTGGDYTAEYRVVLNNGSTRWLYARGRGQLDGAGKPLRFFGVVFDITERRTAEAHLRQQWHTFDTALSHTPDFTYIFDLDGRFTYVNRALLTLWQKSYDEALGKTFFELDYPQHTAERHHREIQRVIATKEPVRDHTPYTGPDGVARHYEYIFVPVLAQDGRVEAVAGSTRDVTDRERMEQALALSEKKLQQVFAEAPVAVCVLRGKDLIYELANVSYQALFPTRQLLGRRLTDAVPELSVEIIAALHSVLDTGVPFAADELLIPLDRSESGVLQDYWFNIIYHPLRDPGGDIGSIVVVAVNVTAQVRARLSLERANRELEEFAYVSSHDLQEPLRMVNIYTQLLLRELQSHVTEDTRLHAEYVQTGVRRMDKLLKDLLTFSREIYVGSEEVNTTSVADLQASLGQAMSTLQNRIDEEAGVIIGDLLPTVRGEESQFAQVFQNLISNALKYRAEEAPRIRITARRNGNAWLIGFADNGIGFAQHHAERIFGLFKRLHKEEYPGTGLGLAICRRIVERYGGRIWAESELGVGSTFWLSLPDAVTQ